MHKSNRCTACTLGQGRDCTCADWQDMDPRMLRWALGGCALLWALLAWAVLA